jgi:RNA polymerase sigma-70 factor (ECF subfamily)
MTVTLLTAQDPGVDAVQPVESAIDAPALAAFDALYREQLPYVWRALRRLGVDERDREDAANDVFYRVYQRLGDLDPKRPIKPWLFAFAARVASDYRRRAYHRREILDHDAVESAVGNVSSSSENEARELVLMALEALDLDKRAVLILHDLDQQTVPEIAAALNIPLNTAYSRLRIAREQFTAAVRRINGAGRSQ